MHKISLQCLKLTRVKSSVNAPALPKAGSKNSIVRTTSKQ
jgi:hypothetical protein